ncbi:MAG: DUF3006 domain-containing protein [Clostridia bacterium]|nr:DUF3006 domain-containing protein [Clostridia bacterium]
MRTFTVDRIEGDKAVLECENGDFVTLELGSLPKTIREGDVIRFNANSCFLDADETERRSEKIRALMERVFEADN